MEIKRAATYWSVHQATDALQAAARKADYWITDTIIAIESRQFRVAKQRDIPGTEPLIEYLFELKEANGPPSRTIIVMSPWPLGRYSGIGAGSLESWFVWDDIVAASSIRLCNIVELLDAPAPPVPHNAPPDPPDDPPAPASEKRSKKAQAARRIRHPTPLTQHELNVIIAWLSRDGSETKADWCQEQGLAEVTLRRWQRKAESAGLHTLEDLKKRLAELTP